MAEFPAMPLWTDAYLGDTRHLTTFEHGAYLLLLIVAWRSPDGALPDDDRMLARYAGCSKSQWARIAPQIRSFFKAENGQLLQSRLVDERKAVKRKRESQIANGRASALKNKERHSAKRPDHSNGTSTPLPLPLPLGSNEPIIDTDVSLSAEPTESPVTVQEIVEAWNSRMVPQGFPAVKRVTGTRLRHLQARIKENSVSDFQTAMAALERSRFCRGENREGWHADFDFFIQSKSFTKLLEGGYAH